MIMKSVFFTIFLPTFFQANALGITGNMKGDGMQLGGTFVIEKGGNVLFHHKQTGFGDHPKLTDLLGALGLSAGGIYFSIRFVCFLEIFISAF